MFTIRLAFVLAFHAFLVAAGLVVITVVYSVLSRNFIEKQVLTVATASIETVRQLVLDELAFVELTVSYLVTILNRLDLNAPLASSSPNIYTYTPTLDVLSTPETSQDIFIATFTLWRTSASEAWSGTGCDRSDSLCYLYNATTNTSEYAAFTPTGGTDAVDSSNAITTSAGPPPRYTRYRSVIDGGNFTVGTLWSPMYMDAATTITTLQCEGVNVIWTFNYFYCTKFGSGTDANGNPICLRLVGATVEAQFSNYFSSTSLLEESYVHLLSAKTVSTVGDVCLPSDGSTELAQKLLASCQTDTYGTCGPIFAAEGAYFYAAVGYSTDNGIEAVLVDIAPRAYFYSAIRSSDTVAIAVSISVILLVVVVSVTLCLFLVIPLSYICTGMKNASSLSYERKVVPLSKYTFITEVRQLVAAYLELRKALTDLKCFVPQGLLAPSDTGVVSLSLLGSLDGSDFSDTDEDGEDDYSKDSEDDASRGDASADISDSGAFGGHGEGRTTTTAPAAASELHAYESVTGMRRRSTGGDACATRHTATARRPRDSPFGLVSVVRFDEAAHEPAAAATTHATDVSISGEGDAGTLIGAAGLDSAPFARGPTAGGGGGSVTAMRRTAPAIEEAALTHRGQTPDRVPRRRRGRKAKDAASASSPVSSPHEYASLNVNPVLLARALNKFRAVTCSVLCVSFSFKYIDSASLETESQALGATVIRTVLRYGGVIELCRPDTVIVSFGAHVEQTQHTQRAAAAAVSLTRQLSAKRRSRTRIVVDSGTMYCGVCGGHGRIFPVVFGDRLDAAVGLLDYDLGLGRLVVTDRVAVCLPTDCVVPIDYVVTLRDRANGTQLFQVLDTRRRRRREYQGMLASYRLGYTLGLSGRYEEALGVVEGLREFDQELAASYATSLRHLINMHPRRPRYCRFQLPAFEPLGVMAKEQQPKFQHAPLRLNELRNETSGTVSINFGFGSSPSTSAAAGTSAGGPHHRSAASGSVERMPGFQSAFNGSLSHHARDVADGSAGSEPFSRHARSMNTAPPRGGADLDAGELPRVFADRRGEVWHRFPYMIGSGAFAEVYKAISANGTIAALKCIRLSDTKIQLEDVVSEVNTACKLDSDFTVTHTGWVHIGSFLIIMMDYMPGGSLSAALSAFPDGVTLQVARRYASDALRGLAYLHSKNVVHADLKPQNMLLSTDGGCRLSDFGSSVTKANAQRCAGDVFHLRGTPTYMSPEVARGEAPSMHSDMWSFGIALYEILTGHTPWCMKAATNPVSTVVVAVVPPSGYDVADLVVTESRAFSRRTSRASSRKGTYRGFGPLPAAPATRHTSSTAAAPPPTDAHGEWVRLQGLSDARVVQGIVNGTVRVDVVASELPNSAAYELIVACLRTVPAERPPARELLDHPFFFTT